MIETSVIILTYNQRELTVRCLESIRDLIEDSDYEVILVDNGSTDGTEDAVKVRFPEIIYIKNHDNKGVAAGRNAGLMRARGRYLMLLDNDTIAEARVIKSLSKYLEDHPDVGLVAPKLVSRQGIVQKSWKSFPGIAVKLRNVLSRGKSDHFADNDPESALEPFYVIGAAQMFPRKVWEKTGHLDEKIFYGPEDADFCMRVRKNGYRIIYNPRLTIIHDWQRATTRKFLSPIGRKHVKALLYFYWKHKRLF